MQLEISTFLFFVELKKEHSEYTPADFQNK